MKISEILNFVNTFEKNAFLRIIDQIIAAKPANLTKIDKILSEIDGQIKNADNESVATVLNLVEHEFAEHIKKEFAHTTSQLDILIDIIMRDGNALMKREWFLKLYDKEVKGIKTRLKDMVAQIEADSDEPRVRDYRIYQECLKAAFNNDLANNRDRRITSDEQSILNALVLALDLSHEEVKLINYSVVPLKKMDIDQLLDYLVKTGVVFYSKKNHQIYVPDEVVVILRKVRGKIVPDKVFRQVLKNLKDSHINLLARRHSIDRKLDIHNKIKGIIKEGVNFRNALLVGIHKDGIKKSEKKEFLNLLIEKNLKIEERIKGASLEAKLDNLIIYFNEKEKEGNISISVDGFDKLINDLSSVLGQFQRQIRNDFEIQENTELTASMMLKYNLRPLDVLYILTDEQIKKFCDAKGISTRGNEIKNILESYKDIENLYLENYVHVSNRDLNSLTANGIDIKEGELGIKFEELTKSIFAGMGFNVDDTLRKNLNDSKNKVDIVISIEGQGLIIIECKSKKERSYNNYSSVSRQVKAYKNLAETKGHRVIKSFIIAPDFTDEFVNECGLDYELNLSLITAESLYKIYLSHKESELKDFPYQILLRDVLVNEERVIKALTR